MSNRTPWYWTLRGPEHHSLAQAYASSHIADRAHDERERLANETADFLRKARARREHSRLAAAGKAA